MEHRYKKCGNCGETFKIPPDPKYNATKYCCQFCRDEAHRKQNQEYEKRCKEQGIFGKKFLGNSNIKPHTEPKMEWDFDQEWKTIQNEFKRLKLRRYGGKESESIKGKTDNNQ